MSYVQPSFTYVTLAYHQTINNEAEVQLAIPYYEILNYLFNKIKVKMQL